jgi:hypothetical protein
MTTTTFQTGTYRHYQGNFFHAVALFEDPENGELMVACERVHDGKKLLRPYATPGVPSWNDTFPGGVKRFKFVSGIAMRSAVLRPCESCTGSGSECSRKSSDCVRTLLKEYGFQRGS